MDKDLLMLAAKAAGIPVKRSRLDDPLHRDFLVEIPSPRDNSVYSGWNPLTDDGDALRLAVTLNIRCGYEMNTPPELGLPRECGIATANGRWFAECNSDKCTAVRRAIVRAAAEIGGAVGRDVTIASHTHTAQGGTNV